MLGEIVYEIFFKETVEIFQIKKDNYQRLVMPKDNYDNFEQLLLTSGFVPVRNEKS